MSSSSSSDDEKPPAPAAVAASTVIKKEGGSPSSGGRSSPHISWSDSYTKAHTAIKSLSSIISHVPPSLTSSETPAFSLLHDPEIAAQMSNLLWQPDSSAGDNPLCRWLYDTFHSSEPDLHLVVLRFLPIIAGVYLSRVALHKPLAGFEAILLALYAHETVARNGNAVTVTIPDLSHSSIYHETKQTAKTNATELALAVISPSLEPYSSVRSTKRARIVGIALELFYTKISQLPLQSKFDFCEFCKIWAGEEGRDPTEPELEFETISNGDDEENSPEPANKNKEKNIIEGKKGRINLSRELLQPTLRILGHCMMGNHMNKELKERARSACRCLYGRAMHDISAKDILATGSLLKLAKLASESSSNEVDYTEITFTNKIVL